MRRICFDHLSGTPVEPAVVEAMQPWLRDHFAGTGAVHAGGVEARAALDVAREQAAAFVHASSPEEIIFTSGGTEALNLAVKGCAWASQRQGKKILVSAIEHPAILQSIEFLEGSGFVSARLPVSGGGRLDPAAVAAAMDNETTLVCVHAGHHDIGTIQDLRAIGEIVADRGAAFLVDATYAGGWMPIDAQAVNASFVALAPHRFGGPKGVGILYKQRRARLAPLLHGGAQELGWRAGTENIPGLVGAGLACQIAASELPGRISHAQALQQMLWRGLAREFPDIRLNGPEPGARRLPNSLNFSLRGLEGEGLALRLDMQGIAITSGQACATKASPVPPVLAALGVPEEEAAGTVIISLHKSNTSEEAGRFLELLAPAVAHLRALREDTG